MELTKENPLGTEPVGKLMLRFAVPSIIAMLVGALYNIVDQLFIGQAIGPDGNAATNIAFPFTTSCISLALMFGIGCASCFNLALGRGEKEKAPFFIGNSLVMLAVSGILLLAVTELFLTPLLMLFGSPDSVLPYAQEYVRITAIGFPFLVITGGGAHLIRADASPGIAMLVNIVGAALNTVLDALFVPVLGWGMAGAATATVIGQATAAAIVIYYVLFRYKTSKITKKHLTPDIRVILKTASIGLASFFNQIAMMVVQIVLNNSLKYYGSISEYGDSIPIACAGIVMKVNQIVFSFAIGLGQGSQPIESYNYGARQYGRVRKAYILASSVSFVIALVSFVFFQIFPREVLSLFGEGSEEYFRFGVSFFRIFLFFVWLVSLQPVTSTFFTSIGKPVKGIILSLTRQIIFFLPALIILPLYFGIDGVVYSGPCADVLSGVVTVIMAVGEFSAMKKLEKREAQQA